MTKDDVEGHINALGQAIGKMDELEIKEAAVQLLGGLLINVARIADALECIAQNTMPRSDGR